MAFTLAVPTTNPTPATTLPARAPIGPKAELAQALTSFESTYAELQDAQQLYADALRQIAEAYPEFKKLRQRISELELALMTGESNLKALAKKANSGIVGAEYEVEHVQPMRKWVDYRVLARVAAAANIDLEEFDGLVGDPVVNLEQFELLFAAGKLPEAAVAARGSTPVSDKGRTTIKKREKKV